ncbi:MAG: hypothetical protein Q9M08_01555 [Mariprofundus sp.]|nr:hypothetical protein [Mariprofundus sp.]
MQVKDRALKFSGWDSPMRVVVLCRALRNEMMITQEDETGQQLLGFIEADRNTGKQITGYEYAALMTHLDYAILNLGQRYRDDAENAFDELKNQWGWVGYTTQDMHRCQIAAHSVALIYNWWSLFVRLADPDARREAMIIRPWLISFVGKRTDHVGQTMVTLTGLQTRFDEAREVLVSAHQIDCCRDWATTNDAISQKFDYQLRLLGLY